MLSLTHELDEFLQLPDHTWYLEQDYHLFGGTVELGTEVLDGKVEEQTALASAEVAGSRSGNLLEQNGLRELDNAVELVAVGVSWHTQPFDIVAEASYLFAAGFEVEFAAV